MLFFLHFNKEEIMQTTTVSIASGDKHDERQKLIERSPNGRSVQGRLFFVDENLPATGYKVTLFTKDFFGFKHYAGEAKTDQDGHFKINYEWKPGLLAENHRFVLGVVERRRPFAEQGFHGLKKLVPLQTIDLTTPVNDRDTDLGRVAAQFAQIPPKITDAMKPEAHHEQPFRWTWKFFKASFPETIKKITIAAFGRFMSISQVQGLYNLFGHKYPLRPLTLDNLIHELQNEICAVDYKVDGDKVTWTANWDVYTFDQVESLPNVVVHAKKADGQLNVEKIEIKYRQDQEPTVVKPGDDNLDWGVYVARSVFALKGEGSSHLGIGHVLPHLIAKSFFKHLRPGNPIFDVAAPHLGQLFHINHLGSKGVIYGKGSVLEASALDEDAVAGVIVSALTENADYTCYSPKEPLSDSHYLAKAQLEYYKKLETFFTNYVENNKDAIKANWHQIFNFSQSMHKRFDKIPPVTTSREAPADGDLKRLAQLLTWVVNLTTFHHWSIHSKQQILTDVRSCSLGMVNRGLDSNGKLDPFGNTPIKVADIQNSIARTLLNWDGDPMVENPYGNMNQGLLDLAKEFTGKLAKEVDFYKNAKEMTVTTQI